MSKISQDRGPSDKGRNIPRSVPGQKCGRSDKFRNGGTIYSDTKAGTADETFKPSYNGVIQFPGYFINNCNALQIFPKLC